MLYATTVYALVIQYYTASVFWINAVCLHPILAESLIHLHARSQCQYLEKLVWAKCTKSTDTKYFSRGIKSLCILQFYSELP